MKIYKIAEKKKLPKITLGKTNLSSSILGIGGGGVIEREGRKDVALETLEKALNLGINYFDTAWSYGNNGESEKRVGEALRNHAKRENVIIASKTPSRNYYTAKKQIEESLKRLDCEYIDILQVHHVGDVDDWSKGKDTTLKAVVEAKEEGLVRHVGVTGHADPQGLLRAINDFDFETILMALNPAEVYHKSFQKKLLPECVKRNIGIIAMKVYSSGLIFNPSGVTKISEAINYAYSLPINMSILGVDNVEQLEENVDAVINKKKIDNREMTKLEEMTEKYHEIALYYRKGLEDYNFYW